jgi:hypothetical protein
LPPALPRERLVEDELIHIQDEQRGSKIQHPPVLARSAMMIAW